MRRFGLIGISSISRRRPTTPTMKPQVKPSFDRSSHAALHPGPILDLLSRWPRPNYGVRCDEPAFVQGCKCRRTFPFGLAPRRLPSGRASDGGGAPVLTLTGPVMIASACCCGRAAPHVWSLSTTGFRPAAPVGGRVGRRPIPKGRAAPFRRPVPPAHSPVGSGISRHPVRCRWPHPVRTQSAGRPVEALNDRKPQTE
jgi:hypothetical protein